MTIEHKHILGPYHVSKFHEKYGYYDSAGRITIMPVDTDGQEFPVARVECHTPYKRGQGDVAKCELRDATAALIAASPELAKALETMLDRFADYEQYDNDGLDIAAINQAHAALAKAKGKML